jgi:hypothetical protein
MSKVSPMNRRSHDDGDVSVAVDVEVNVIQGGFFGCRLFQHPLETSLNAAAVCITHVNSIEHYADADGSLCREEQTSVASLGEISSHFLFQEREQAGRRTTTTTRSVSFVELYLPQSTP